MTNETQMSWTVFLGCSTCPPRHASRQGDLFSPWPTEAPFRHELLSSHLTTPEQHVFMSECTAWSLFHQSRKSDTIICIYQFAARVQICAVTLEGMPAQDQDCTRPSCISELLMSLKNALSSNNVYIMTFSLTTSFFLFANGVNHSCMMHFLKNIFKPDERDLSSSHCFCVRGGV